MNRANANDLTGDFLALVVAHGDKNGVFPGLPVLRVANRAVEFHYYEQGGHGFGMYPKETTSTGWFDAYVKWLGMHGYLKPKT